MDREAPGGLRIWHRRRHIELIKMIKINIRTNEPGLLRRRGDRPEYIDVRQREHLLAVACGRAEPVTPARRRELPVNPVRWGLLATASIGRVMVEAARRLTAARFVAGGGRGGGRAGGWGGGGEPGRRPGAPVRGGPRSGPGLRVL